MGTSAFALRFSGLSPPYGTARYPQLSLMADGTSPVPHALVVKCIVRRSFVPTADEFRRLSAECLELAPKISPDLRAMFVGLAEGWANLADFLDEEHSILPDWPPTGEDNNSNGDTGDRGEDWVE